MIFTFFKNLFAHRSKPMTANDYKTFTAWFNDQGFRNFSSYEVESYFRRTRNGVRNSEPPSHLWPNIVPTLRIVDDLRDALGVPIYITSSYRSPEYNRAVGGASMSEHLKFRALDISSNGATPHEIYNTLTQWRNSGKFSGGIGRYPGFTHVDTRGLNATW